MSKQEKRDCIIQAALELIAEQGFHGAPMADIAERAGVAAGTIYRYFESKDVMIREIHDHLKGQLMASLLEEYPEGAPVRERFLHIGQRLIRFFIQFPLEFRFLGQFYNSPYGVMCRQEKMLSRKDDLITNLLDEGQRQQFIKDLPMPIIFSLTFGPIIDVCRDHILGFTSLDDELIRRTIEACWDALKR